MISERSSDDAGFRLRSTPGCGSREKTDLERQPGIRFHKWRIRSTSTLSHGAHPVRLVSGIRRRWGKFPISTGRHRRVPITQLNHPTDRRLRGEELSPRGACNGSRKPARLRAGCASIARRCVAIEGGQGDSGLPASIRSSGRRTSIRGWIGLRTI